MADDSKPRAQDIVEMAHHYFGRMSEAHVEMTQMLDLVNKKFQPFKDVDRERWEPLIPGTAGSMVHRFAHQIVTDKPIVTYAPRSSSQRALADADLAEAWGQNVIEQVNAASIESPMIAAAKWALLGQWVLKGPLFDSSAWPDPPGPGADEEEKRHFEIQQADTSPFTLEAIDPRQCVWDDVNPMNPYWTIRRSNIYMWMATRKLPKGVFANANRKRDNDVVERLEYWDRHWRITLLDGQPVSYWREDEDTLVSGAIPNIYGYNPYQVGYGPWSLSTGTPAEQARSMLFFVRDELFEEARISSIKRWASQLYGLAPFVSDDPERTAEEMSAGPGAIISPGDGRDIPKTAPRPLEMPSPPDWLDNYEANNNQRIKANTASDSLLGNRQTGTTSALMEGVLMGEGRQQFEPIVTQLQRHMNRFLNRCAWISEKLVEEPQTLWNNKSTGRDTTTIKPDLWRGQYHYKISLEPLDPSRDDRRAMLGLNLFSQGLISPWTALEDYLKIPNANDELKRVLMWRAMNSPEFQQLLVQMAAQENDVEDAIAQLLGGEGGSGGPVPGNVGDFSAFDQAMSAGIPENETEPGFELETPGTQAQGAVFDRGNRVDTAGNFP